MPTINITDQFGLNISATPNPSFTFSKYLKDPLTIFANLGSVQDIGKLRISDDPFKSASVGLQFKQPVKLGSTGVELDIQPALLATVAIATGGAGKTLFDSSDPFGDSIAIPDNSAYLSLAIQATLDLSLNDKATADLKFGFNNQTKVVFTDYRLFPTSDPIVESLTTLVENYTIPGDIPDIEAMPVQSIATVQGSGSLKFSAEADLPVGVNPLATVSENVLGGALSVKTGGSVTLKGAFTLTGGYQVRIERQEGRKFQLGFLKQRSTEFDVSIEASLGATASIGGVDLIQALMKATSPDPVPDKDTLKQAGLTDDQISSINSAIRAGLERSLQIAVSAELQALRQNSTAFSYMIDLDQVDADLSGAARKAINMALDGDLSGLELGQQSGITLIRSIFSSLRDRKEIFKLNLLGIFSVGSLTELVQKGSVVVDQESGAITITDKTTAQNIGFTSANFAKNGTKLRSILADSMIITAAYRTAGTVPVAQFASSQWFFDFRQKTNAGNLDDYLNIALALNAPPPDQVKAQLAALRNLGSALGRSTFNVSAAYTDPIFRILFLAPNGSARSQDEYERIARSALVALIPPGNPTSDARRAPLSDDTLWNDLVAASDENITLITFFEKYPELRNYSAIIGSDFEVVIWWASAMAKMAQALAALLTFFAKYPKWSKDDNQFKQLHNALNNVMGHVASNTKSHFREPLGLLAMDIASDRKAPTLVELSSPMLSFKTIRQLG
ncbi:MAG: hypothetical protein ACYCOX_15025 [Acidobacteriaceae bacterium]